MDRHQSLSLNVTVSSGNVVALSVCLLSYSVTQDETELDDSVVLPCSIPVIDFITHLYRELRCDLLRSYHAVVTPTANICAEARRFALSNLRQPRDVDYVIGTDITTLILASAVEAMGTAIVPAVSAAILPHIMAVGARNATGRMTTQYVYRMLDGNNVAGDDLPEIVKLACEEFKTSITKFGSTIAATYTPRGLALRAVENELMKVVSASVAPTLVMSERDGAITARIAL